MAGLAARYHKPVDPRHRQGERNEAVRQPNASGRAFFDGLSCEVLLDASPPRVAFTHPIGCTSPRTSHSIPIEDSLYFSEANSLPTHWANRDLGDVLAGIEKRAHVVGRVGCLSCAFLWQPSLQKRYAIDM